MSAIDTNTLTNDQSKGLAERFFDSDLWHSFKSSPITVVSAIVATTMILAAIFAPLIAPYDPFDLSTIYEEDAFQPPIWIEKKQEEAVLDVFGGGGTTDVFGNPIEEETVEDNTPKRTYLLGTDQAGRDIFSTILYGSRISIFVGFASVIFSIVLGVSLGLISGYMGGRVDAVIMRLADIQLSFPAILIALLIDGMARTVLPRDMHDEVALYVLVFAIGISGWVQYARTVRGSTMVEKGKEYVQAARVIGIRQATILVRHILPNVMGPVLVIGTIHLAIAVITEATLSFLGVGVPPTTPSLGTLIQVGNKFINSGEWWITIFPGLALILLVLAVNLLGDWLRDALNPKLR